MGHTTFVLAKNIPTWTDCIEDKRSMSKFNTFEKWLFSPIAYISLKAVGVGSSMGVFGERFTGSKPPNELFAIQKLKFIKQYNTMSCHEANQIHRRRLGTGQPGHAPSIIKMRGNTPFFAPQ